MSRYNEFGGKLREGNDTINNVVERLLKIGHRRVHRDEVEAAHVNSQRGAGGHNSAQIFMLRLRPRVEEGGRHVKHFRGDL